MRRELPVPLSRHLPLEAALILRRAAQTPVTDSDRLARIKAVEQANQKVRRLWPQFFQK